MKGIMLNKINEKNKYKIISLISALQRETKQENNPILNDHKLLTTKLRSPSKQGRQLRRGIGMKH